MPGGRIDLTPTGHPAGPHAAGRDPAGWFVRRAGLARFTTFACALGLALPAMTGPRPVLAFAGLTTASAGALAGLCRRRSRRWSCVLLASVLLIGLFMGCLIGTLRVAALTDSELEACIGSRVEAELVITGPVRANSGWQSATAAVIGLRSGDVAASAAAGAAPAADGPATGGPAGPAAGGPGMGETVLLEVSPEDAGPAEGGSGGGDAAGGAAASGSPAGESAAGGAAALALEQGMIVRFTGTIDAPEGPSDTGYDQAARLLHQGIKVVFAGDGAASVTVLGHRGGVAGWFDRLRAAAKEHLSMGPDARVGEALQGVVLGDTVGIDEGWMDAFRRSGTAHMLSVSGLHVGSIAVIVIGLARLLGAARWVGFIMAALSALLMIPFVGPSPPIVRAAVMIVIVLAGRWLGRGRDQWQVLGLAGVVILALNPFALYDVGFQLSFAAFGGMLALTGPLQRLLRRLPQAIASNVAVSIAASLGTAPVSLAVFDRTSLVSPLANLLVVPLLPAVTGLGMASAFLGFAWHGLSAAFDTLAAVPMTWTVLVSRLMAMAPVLEAGDLGMAAAALATGAVVLPAALALTGRTVSTPFGLPLPWFKRSLTWLRRHRPRSRRWAAVLGTAAVTCGLLVGGVAYPAAVRAFEVLKIVGAARDWPDQVEIRVLDVGQGNAVLVRTPQGHALLFDGGPEGCDLAGQLHALGVRSLDLVLISHPHADHFAGLLEGLEGLEVEALMDQVVIARAGPAAAPDAATAADGAEAAEYLELRHRLADEGCGYAQAATGFSVTVDGVVVRLFAPTNPLVIVEGADPWGERGGPPTGDELNAASVVAVVSVGSVDMLIPGDAEAEVLRRYDLPPAELVLVPHHGSRGAVSEVLLAGLGARAAVISVGADNSFGHPHAGTVGLLERAGLTVLRTDTAGWVSCEVNGDTLAITTERTPAR